MDLAEQSEYRQELKNIDRGLVRIRSYSARGIKVQGMCSEINKMELKRIHAGMNGRKATGVDGVTKEEYQEKLEENLDKLIERMKQGSYRPQASKRVYIEKPGTRKKRPLGISAYEDKLVENRVAELLEAVYEPKFLDCSYGFRPQRNCHMAIKKVIECVQKRKTSYVVEADIKSFFDNIDHEWMIQFLEHDIADRKLLGLIKKMLKADIMEKGKKIPHERGSAQGNGASPVLANVYLHYVLDTWFEIMVKRCCKGMANLVRYADDFVCCFQTYDDAIRFYNELPKRLGKFGLEVAEEKTRIIQFGRFAEATRRKAGLGKPETFDFLGFTFYCGRSRNRGLFQVKVKSSRRKMVNKLKQMNEWMKKNRHEPVKEIVRKINQALTGYYHYYGVTNNIEGIQKFRRSVTRIIYKWLNRRSQKRSYTWEGFNKGLLTLFPIVKARIYVDIRVENVVYE